MVPELDGSITYKGGGGIDTVTGTAGADTISGNAGADVITGGKGADAITGGDEADYSLTLLLTSQLVQLRIASLTTCKAQINLR